MPPKQGYSMTGPILVAVDGSYGDGTRRARSIIGWAWASSTGEASSGYRRVQGASSGTAEKEALERAVRHFGEGRPACYVTDAQSVNTVRDVPVGSFICWAPRNSSHLMVTADRLAGRARRVGATTRATYEEWEWSTDGPDGWLVEHADRNAVRNRGVRPRRLLSSLLDYWPA